METASLESDWREPTTRSSRNPPVALPRLLSEGFGRLVEIDVLID
jgi:hypothetical protein